MPAATRPAWAALAAPAGGRGGKSRQVIHGWRRFVGELGGKDHAHPPVQLIEAQAPLCVVLPQQRDEPLTIGIADPGAWAARPRRGHRYAVGRTTTAVP
jgi:hypothetical protein